MKVMRYAGQVVARHDLDGDGRLQAAEWGRISGDLSAVDLNGDGEIVADELASHIADYGARRRIRLVIAPGDTGRLPSLLPHGGESSGEAASDASDADFPPALAEDHSGAPAAEEAALTARKYVVGKGRLPTGLPPWFLERDLDGDGQLTQSEFSPTASLAAMKQFAQHDSNGDGLLTPRELTGRAPKPANREPEPPQRATAAEPPPASAAEQAEPATPDAAAPDTGQEPPPAAKGEPQPSGESQPSGDPSRSRRDPSRRRRGESTGD